MTRFFNLACILLIGTLNGCANVMPPNMLGTAPRSEAEVLYPNWGGETEIERLAANKQYIQRHEASTLSKSSLGKEKGTDIQRLMAYMDKKRIRYKVIKGQHPLIKLDEKILFKTGSAYISLESEGWLRELGRFLASKSNIKTVIDGHTDSTGNNAVNDPLSDKRAMQVKLLFTREKVPTSNVYTRGYGKHIPSCTNLSKQGMACNRRVELMFITSK